MISNKYWTYVKLDTFLKIVNTIRVDVYFGVELLELTATAGEFRAHHLKRGML